MSLILNIINLSEDKDCNLNKLKLILNNLDNWEIY